MVQLKANENMNSRNTSILSLILRKLSSYNLSPKFVHAKIIPWPFLKSKRRAVTNFKLCVSISFSCKYSVICFFIFLSFLSKVVLELMVYIYFFRKCSSYHCFHFFPSPKQWSQMYLKSRKINIVDYIQYTSLCRYKLATTWSL